MNKIESVMVSLDVSGTANELWTLSLNDGSVRLPIAAPVFEIDGVRVVAELDSISPAQKSGAPRLCHFPCDRRR